jgi:REP element-mobilizing transposase RayT
VAHSFTDLLCHVVFATKGRNPGLWADVRDGLFTYVRGVLETRSCLCLAVNGMDEHVHVLSRVHPSVPVADLVRDLKAGASGWVHRTHPDLVAFAWQTGYGAFAVSQSMKNAVRSYIDNQQSHHREVSFTDEMRRLVRLHGIQLDDESVLWE